MTPKPGPLGARPRLSRVAGALGVMLVLALTACTAAGPEPVSTTATPAGSTTPPGTSAEATPSAPVETPTPSATPEDTPTPTPTPDPRPTAYCEAFGRIEAGGIDAGGDSEGVDFVQLGKTFDALLSKYSAAAKLAPASLKDEYDKVLGYLRQGKAAVESKNLNQLKRMVRNLSSLNDTMSAIQNESHALCD